MDECKPLGLTEEEGGEGREGEVRDHQRGVPPHRHRGTAAHVGFESKS